MSSDAASPYQIVPLHNPETHIRLLKVLPGSRNEPVSCTVDVVRRDSGRQYVAVSYTWGAAHLLEEIWINGQSAKVRHNCWYALWQIRLHGIDLPLWIDSICIDQSNNKEKSSQVRIMGSIYSRATCTVACIGSGSELDAVIEDVTAFESTRFDDRLFPNYHDVPDNLPDMWRNLLELAQLPYFLRLWIVQELYHSTTIQLFGGENMLLWDDLEPYFLAVGELAAGFERNAGALPAGYVALDETVLARFIHFRKFRRAQTTLKTEWTDEITGHGFTGVLLSFGGGACFDPRDKIYGLLSLAQDRTWQVNFPIDYNRELSDVVLDVVIRIGNESLTENVSRLMVTMLEWFDITAESRSGRTLLAKLKHQQIGPHIPWNNFTANVVPFESVHVWRISRVPLYAVHKRIPRPENIGLGMHSDSVESGDWDYMYAPFDWRVLCFERARMISSPTEWLWIAGPDVQPGDFIVQFDAMRDEKDEYNVTLICRPRSRKSDCLDIIDHASMCLDIKRYDDLYNTRHSITESPLRLSRIEKDYIKLRQLFARPQDDRITIYLKPTDLLKIAMVRGQVIQHVRHPVSSATSGCYAIKTKVDQAEVKNRTRTFTVEGIEQHPTSGQWQMIARGSEDIIHRVHLTFGGLRLAEQLMAARGLTMTGEPQEPRDEGTADEEHLR